MFLAAPPAPDSLCYAWHQARAQRWPLDDQPTLTGRRPARRLHCASHVLCVLLAKADLSPASQRPGAYLSCAVTQG